MMKKKRNLSLDCQIEIVMNVTMLQFREHKINDFDEQQLHVM